jgi:Fe-S-cluster containining protein
MKLDAYREILRRIDSKFHQIRSLHGRQMQCGKGCAMCCHGLFDISLADAVGVAEGFATLSPATQAQVLRRAETVQNSIGLHLMERDDPRTDQVADSFAEPPSCPMLGPSNECLIYDQRPLACRLEGLPMVDKRDGLFADWCELNFVDGVSQTARANLTLDYDAIAMADEMASAEVAAAAGIADPHSVVFIPTVAVYFERFWNHVVSAIIRRRPRN